MKPLDYHFTDRHPSNGMNYYRLKQFDFNGEANLEINYCASQANSSNGNGLRQVGHPSFKAKEIGVTGGFTGSGYSPQPIAGTTPIPDPYAALSEPPLDSCHSMSGQMLQQTTATLTPGTYCGGLWIKAQSVITLSPGNYIMKDGPLTIDSNATVSGDEVMLAFLGETSTMYLIGGATLAVTSPTSGTYKNIQFFGDRKVHGKKQESLWFTVIGNSKLTYDGVLYAPSFHVWWAGGSLIEGKSPSYIAVAKKLWFQDHTQVRLYQTNSRNLNVEASAPLEYGTTLFR